MAVFLSASLLLAEAMCSKVSLCSACIQSGLGDCVPRVRFRCACTLKNSPKKTKLKVTLDHKTSTLTEVCSCLRLVSPGLLKLPAAGFTHDSWHDPIFCVDYHSSRHKNVAAVATISSETCLVSDESTIISAAEQAMAFAAAALDAAKYALEFHDGDHVSDSFPSDHDMLKLSKLVDSGTSCSRGGATVSDHYVGVSQFVGEVKDPDFSQRSSSGVDLDPSTGTSASLHDFRKVLEEMFTGVVDQESEGRNKGIFPASKTDVIAVKSVRRNDRTHKRDRVRKKIEKIKGSTEALHLTASVRSPLASSSTTDSVGGFLRTIKKKRLLTSAEEKQLAGRVQFLLKAEKLKVALEKLVGHEPTTREVANVLGMEPTAFQRKLLACRQGKARMIYCNLGLVISVAKRFQGQGIPLQDLVQEGIMGLIRGIEKFKPSLGFKLSTYAHWWIWEAISRAVNTKSKAAVLPVNVAETLLRVHKVRTAFSEEHGRQPTEEELAKATKLSLNRLRTIQFYSKAVKSADRPVGEDDFSTLGALIVDDTPESYQAVCNRQYIKEDVEAFLLCLTERERQIVKLRFPTDGRAAMTLEEIGITFNVTRERIRQIERIAMEKLKCPQGRHLKSYFEIL